MNALIVGALAVGYPRLVKALGQDAGLIVAADGGGAACSAAGLLPAVVVGDLDSLPREESARLSGAGVPFVTAPSAKDVTDLDLAMEAARRRGARELRLTGVLGARIDHTLATVGSLARGAHLKPVVHEPNASAWLLAAGHRSKLRLSGAGCTVSLFALAVPARLSCNGLRYPLSAEVLPPLDSRGLSNVIESEVAVIEVLEGVALAVSEVAEPGRPPAIEVGGPALER